LTYLVAAAIKDDLAAIRQSAPQLWRQVRRFNLPVQLALAAAEEAISSALDPCRAAVISLAPCQPGSADLYRWGEIVTAGMAEGNLGDTRMNPTQTLHAVDNLAMSAFAIMHGNHAYCLGLGGAAGQAWAALEAVQERLAEGHETEALLMAGDQAQATDCAAGIGVALLFSASPRPFDTRGQVVRLISIERRRKRSSVDVVPHAAAGLCGLLSAIAGHHSGNGCSYIVPPEHADGVDEVTVHVEVSG
jgi:hypothetical protein